MRRHYTENKELIEKYHARYIERQAKQPPLKGDWSEESTRDIVYKHKNTKNYRKICQKKIRRMLCPGEHIHHINGDHNDDRPENLEPLAAWEHGVKHGFIRPRR